ncbi:hypothetical protein [Mycobacterium sp. HUMS_1102779]
MPGYRTALDIADQARTFISELARPEPIDPADDPLNGGSFTEWPRRVLAHRSAIAIAEQERAILVDVQQRATAAARTCAVQNIDALLTHLNTQLMALLDDAKAIVDQLGGATTPEEAVANDAGPQWKTLGELANDYATLRDAQREVMYLAPADVNMGARRANGRGDDHASRLFLRNISAVWPDWQRPDHTAAIRIDGSQPRLEPWPEHEYSAQMLAWLVTSAAEPWVPTLRELQQQREQRRRDANPNPTVIEGIRSAPLNAPLGDYDRVIRKITARKETTNVR